MKQKKLHRKGSSDCSALDPMTSPLSVPGETTFADDDPGSDVINMAVACVSGHVTVESSAESALRLAVFEQRQQRQQQQQQQQQQLSDDDDDDDNIHVDSSATESDADL